MKNTMSLIFKCTENRKIRVILFTLSYIFIFGFILFMNIKTPLMGDDLTYQYIFDSTERIKSFADIVESQYIHYNVWGGRTVVHTIAQILLMFDPLTQDIINALAFLLLIEFIYLHINYKKPFSISLFWGIFLLLWFLEPFAETVLWITGSANYMWGTILVLAFLLPYRFYDGQSKNKILSYSAILLMLLFGIIAGWTNENIAGAMLLSIILYILYYKKNKWNIPVWIYSGFVGALTGYILMIAAPGNAVRAEGTETSLFLILYRIFRHTQALLNNTGLLNIGFVLLLFFYIRKYKYNNQDILLKTGIYFIASLSAVYVMVFSPTFPDRAWFGAIVFNIIALGIVVVNFKDRIVLYIKYGFVILGLLVIVFNFYDINKELDSVKQIIAERETLILKSKAEGKKSVTFTEYSTQSKYVVADPKYSAPLLTRYYGIEVKYAGIETEDRE